MTAMSALAYVFSLPVGCTNRATPPRDTVTSEGHQPNPTHRISIPSYRSLMLSAGEAPAQLLLAGNPGE